jgi:hypothetical protein
MQHQLKTWDVYFDAVKRGEKTFEVRRDDRGFQKGDTLELLRCEKSRLGSWEVQYKAMTRTPEHVLHMEITYVLTGGQFGIEPGFVVMGIKPCNPEAPQNG